MHSRATSSLTDAPYVNQEPKPTSETCTPHRPSLRYRTLAPVCSRSPRRRPANLRLDPDLWSSGSLPTMAEFISTVTRDDGVALLRIDRPPMNALSLALLGELADTAVSLAT